MSITFIAFALTKGIPALRHDWAFPLARDQFRIAVLDAASGWTRGGIGAPNARPSTYLLVPLLLAANAVGGPLLGLGALLASITAVISAAARALVPRATPPAVRIGLTAFLLFNPWVYVELVAGHLAMLFAYGSLGLVLGAAINPELRMRKLTLAAIGTLTQVQFGVFGVAIALVRLAFERRVAPGLVILLCASPMLLGIALSGTYLRSVPIATTWEASQSISPLAALGLSGYFTRYDAGIEPWGIIVASLIAALAATALPRMRRENAILVVAAALPLIVLAISGSKGPLASTYQDLLQNFVPIRAFRELYDLVGLIALGYAFLAARSVLPRMLSAGAIILALALPAIWMLAPPSRFWLDAASIPAARIPKIAPGTRLALLPAFQPMTLGGRGSGTDPDYYRALLLGPVLNQYFPDEPVAAAFSAYAHGDPQPLRKLGVSAIVTRPWLSSDEGALSGQGLALLRGTPRTPPNLSNAAPLVALVSPPRVEFDPSLGRDGIFLTDAAPLCGSCARQMRVLQAPRDLGDPRRSWVDVADAIALFPQSWQPVGGAVTASTDPLILAVSRSERLLVRVEGRLIIDGAALKIRPATYTWIALPEGSHRLVCSGLCSVVGAVDDLPRIPVATPGDARAISAVSYGPWLLRISLPKGAPALLRVQIRYDSHWVALDGTHLLRHVAVDTIFNGWLAPRRMEGRSFLVFNWLSGTQTLLELAALLAVVITWLCPETVLDP